MGRTARWPRARWPALPVGPREPRRGDPADPVPAAAQERSLEPQAPRARATFRVRPALRGPGEPASGAPQGLRRRGPSPEGQPERPLRGPISEGLELSGAAVDREALGPTPEERGAFQPRVPIPESRGEVPPVPIPEARGPSRVPVPEARGDCRAKVGERPVPPASPFRSAMVLFRRSANPVRPAVRAVRIGSPRTASARSRFARPPPACRRFPCAMALFRRSANSARAAVRPAPTGSFRMASA